MGFRGLSERSARIDACLDCSTLSSTEILDWMGASGLPLAGLGEAGAMGDLDLDLGRDLSLKVGGGDKLRRLWGELKGEDGAGEAVILT
jgi:hypothetical protein